MGAPKLKGENSQKTRTNCPKTCFAQENRRQISRENSVDPYQCVQKRNMVTGVNPTPHTVLTGQPMQSREPL